MGLRRLRLHCPPGSGGGADEQALLTWAVSGLFEKLRFLQQPRHRLNTHLLPWTQKSL